MAITRQQKKKEELVATNSEEYLAKQWDALFKPVRAIIERVLKSGRDLHTNQRALVIEHFRDCISGLKHFRFNRLILLEKSKDLLAVVGEICAYGRSNIGTRPLLLIELLEVFIKEALVHPILRHLLDSSRHRLLEAFGAPSIKELMLGHLYLSYPKQISPNFTDSFCHTLAISNASNDGGASELGLGLDLDSTLALLNTTFSSGMPYLLQAHVAILASRFVETRNPDRDFGFGFDRAITAFELSANLYWRSLCDLDLGQKSRPYLSRRAKSSSLNHAPDSHTDDKMMLLFRPNRSKKVAQKDLLSSISCYIDETQRAMHESSRLQTGDALKGIVSMLLADKELAKKRGARCKISQEMVSLAAFARLMGSSLFRVVAEARATIGRREKKDLGLEGRLMSSLDLEGRLAPGTEANGVVIKVLLDAISVGSSSRKRSVLLLKHFLKLMLVGLRARVDFIWKACVLVLSAIMNLMAFEGEDFDAIRMLGGDTRHPMETAEGSTSKRKMKGKQVDASKLPNAKRQCLVDKDVLNGEASRVCADLPKDLVDFFKRPPEDLADFVDCSPDMDLPCWLREKEELFKKANTAKRRRKKMMRVRFGMST